MELVRAAIRYDNFGLRESFEWSREDLESDNRKSNITLSERNYLTNLFRPIFRNGRLDIERIENPYLWGRYVLQYEEMKAESVSCCVKEQIMIHGTSVSNAHSIAEDNFNWRLVKRARFGNGISFTDDPEYAKSWATRRNVYIVAGILVAKSSQGSWNQTIPDAGEDTTTGFTKGVCIKYYDNDFYPYYIVQE